LIFWQGSCSKSESARTRYRTFGLFRSKSTVILKDLSTEPSSFSAQLGSVMIPKDFLYTEPDLDPTCYKKKYLEAQPILNLSPMKSPEG
jgi:hypothetical protein